MSVNTIQNLLERAACVEPDKVWLIDGNDRYTYSEFKTKVDKIAQYLSTLGYPKGSRVGIYSNKSSQQVIAILAILSTEYLFVPITRLLKPNQVQHIIDDCGISCIITDCAKIADIKAIDFKGKIISYEATEQSDVSFEEIYKFYDGDIAIELHGHDNACITYSFGSLGNPRGIVIDNRALIDGARIVANYLGIRKGDSISGILSFNLDYGLNQIFATLYRRATLVIHRFVLPADFFTHLINDKITILPLMPIHITQMFDTDQHRIPQPEHFQNLHTITSSGGNVTTTMIEKIESYFPHSKFYAMHGLTEAFRSSYLEPAQLSKRPTSIGKAIPDVELYIIDEDGYECKAGETGELIHRGACIYRGYWNDSIETQKRFKSISILDNIIKPEGQLRDEIVIASGDYVKRDEDGYIYFVSRKDEMIKTRGYRVSPYEIERVIENTLPQIDSCAVFAIPNEDIEEEIVLVYSAKAELARNEILFEVKKHLPNYMLPEQIVYRKILPFKSLHEKEIDREEIKRGFLTNR